MAKIKGQMPLLSIPAPVPPFSHPGASIPLKPLMHIYTGLLDAPAHAVYHVRHTCHIPNAMPK